MYRFRLLAAATAVAASVSAIPAHAFYEDLEVTVELKNETAAYIQDGPKTSDPKTTQDLSSGHDAGDLMKFENSARFFINGPLGEESTWHAELNIICDTEGVNADYECHRSYTQHDWLRELYLDTRLAGWYLRLGKQQVVWGTADGIKLLDIINPTDFRELNQNTFENSRIPVWMVNAERNVGERGNVQLILSQHEEHKVPGLNKEKTEGIYFQSGNPLLMQTPSNAGLRSVDRNHPFLLKGVDTITGRVNGFANIAPAFGGVAQTFHLLAAGGGANLTFFPGATVNDFSVNNPAAGGFAAACGPLGPFGAAAPGDGTDTSSACLDLLAQLTNQRVTNAIDQQSITNPGSQAGASPEWQPSTPDSAFEYVSNTTFATFDSFVGLQSVYRRDYPDEVDPNFGARFRSYTDGGTNYSLNYFYAYDPNPSISLSWRAADGTPVSARVGDPTAQGGAYAGTNTVTLHDSTGAQRCSAAGGETGCQLVFTEELHRVHNIGASFDTALDALEVPVVVRGEFLYQKDTRVPVIDRGELSIGNFTEGLKPEEADFFKYVIGVDVTVFTNLLVSGQFIQFRNLDYVDEGSSRIAGMRRYTADPATLSLTNDLNKGYKNKEFYSLFFSKPFGEGQLGRWNNITIYEEGGGWWNRLDAEYSLSDRLIVTGELNVYWGEEDTLFGQFDESSNVQVGARYIIQ